MSQVWLVSEVSSSSHKFFFSFFFPSICLTLLDKQAFLCLSRSYVKNRVRSMVTTTCILWSSRKNYSVTDAEGLAFRAVVSRQIWFLVFRSLASHSRQRHLNRKHDFSTIYLPLSLAVSASRREV